MVQAFPRAHTPEGKPVEEASSLSKNVLEADKRAFCRIMQHLRDHDAQEQTVIMVQVENEIGMIEVPRDYSADATRMYQSAVPQQLTDYLKKYQKSLHLKKYQKSLHPYLKEKLQPKAQAGANWPQLFGDDIYTEEIFQTWTYATYVEQIAKAGRDIYNLPMYVNVALNSRDRKPGQYPSGGPLAHLIDLWHCGAPSIDVLTFPTIRSSFLRYDWTTRMRCMPSTPSGIMGLWDSARSASRTIPSLRQLMPTTGSRWTSRRMTSSTPSLLSAHRDHHLSRPTDCCVRQSH